MNARAEAALSDLEPAALAEDHVRGRDADVVEDHLGVVALVAEDSPATGDNERPWSEQPQQPEGTGGRVHARAAPSRVGQHVASAIAKKRSVTTRLKDTVQERQQKTAMADCPAGLTWTGGS